MKPVNKPLHDWLDRNDPDGSRYLFNGICKKWETIVGPETAALVKPLARKNSTLILGARDSVVIQEISFLSGQILELVNSFCGSVFFDKVRVELLRGRTPLDRNLVNKPETRFPEKKPEKLGYLRKILNEDSPVARCYASYVKFFGKQEKGAHKNNSADSK